MNDIGADKLQEKNERKKCIQRKGGESSLFSSGGKEFKVYRESQMGDEERKVLWDEIS